jgi:hypothetical protein
MRAPLFCQLALALVLSGCSAPGGHDDLSMSEATPRLDRGWIAALHFGGVDRLLPDPRDAGLLRALGMVDERLLELAAEQGKSLPEPVVDLLCELLSAPWTLYLGFADDPAVTQPAFRALLVVNGTDADAAEAWSLRLRNLLATFGLASREAESDPDLIAVALPAGDLVYGAYPDDSELVLAWGPVDDLPEGFGPALPASAEPTLVVDVELGRMLEAVGARQSEQANPLFALLGDALHSLGLSLSAGHTPEGTVVRARYRNWARLMSALELLDRGPLGGATLAAIPADATLVNLSRCSPDGVVELLEKLEAASGEALLARFEDALGLPLEELVEPFEGTFGYFLSDTTGGGGLTSAVALASVSDTEQLCGVLERVLGRLDRVLPEVKGRVRTFTHGEATCWAVDFPGLPIPLEPSLGLGAGHLFVAAAPQALRAALDQAATGGGGLTHHTALRGLPRGTLEGLTTLQVIDTPRLLRDGYGLLGLLTTGLENALRSPANAEREPGPVLPGYRELLVGARPTLMLARLDGDDLVATGEADGSTLAQVGAALTYLPPLMLPGILAGTLGARSTAVAEGAGGASPFVYELF